jgi:hypothetical protein
MRFAAHAAIPLEFTRMPRQVTLRRRAASDGAISTISRPAAAACSPEE